jgi:biotin carboxyl carrier protein
MKKLRITVAGKVYEVVVEVLEDDEQYLTGSTLGVPQTTVRPTRAAAPAAAPPPASHPVGPGDPNAIRSPIAGTVQKVFVEAGQRVDEKVPVILLDAMKMDTYIYAPRAGEIVEVAVKPGDAVQVGQPLIRYRAEG